MAVELKVGQIYLDADTDCLLCIAKIVRERRRLTPWSSNDASRIYFIHQSDRYGTNTNSWIWDDSFKGLIERGLLILKVDIHD